MKKRFSLGKRALALALSMVMCVGMLQVTAFAEDVTTTEPGPSIVERTGDENNGSSTTTTTTVETTVKTETETQTPVKTGPVTTQGESKKTDSETKSDVLVDESNTTEKDLSFEASGTIDLTGGSGSGTVSKEVTAEGIAEELGWTCKDSSSGPELTGDNTVVSSETKVTNKDGVYSVESTKTTTETNYGEKEVVNSEEISKDTTTSESKTPGIPADPTVGDPTEEVKLPERPTAGTTQHEDGTSTVVRVEDVTDENNVTTGYIVITEERDAEGNVTSTRTENVSGTQKVEKTESVVEDKTTNTTTTETKTKVEEVLEDKVITTTKTERNEVSVCENQNKLSANIDIDITDYANQGTIGDNKSEVVLGKQNVASADVALKQTTIAENGETKVSMDVAFTFEIQKGADPNKLFVTIYNRGNKDDKLDYGTVKIDTTNGKSGKVIIPDVNLTGLSKCDLVFDISYSDVNASGEGKDFYAALEINMVVDNIQTIGAAAKHTEATTKKEDVTTTKYEREDVTVETESVTTVTTTTTTKTVTTDTVNREWRTVRPEPDTTTPGGTTPGGTTGGGGGGTTGGDDPVIDIPDENPPLVDEPVIDIPDEETPLVEIPDDEVPLVEIPDEDVPLADVPQTGDTSSMWYLSTLLSACCLAILTLRKKDNG